MPRVSKVRPLEPNKKTLYLDDFWCSITSLENKQETVAFFKDLLTPEEQLMLAKRFRVAMMLISNYPWDEIDEEVKVTQGTIAATKWKLESPREGLKKIAVRIIEIKRSILEKRHSKRSSVPGGGELLRVVLNLALSKVIKGVRQRRRSFSIVSH
jgi:uncharacterized protein YerC